MSLKKKLFVLNSYFEQSIFKTHLFLIFLLRGQQKMTPSTVQEVNGLLT